jgi:hypothetical protein
MRTGGEASLGSQITNVRAFRLLCTAGFGQKSRCSLTQATHTPDARACFGSRRRWRQRRDLPPLASSICEQPWPKSSRARRSVYRRIERWSGCASLRRPGQGADIPQARSELLHAFYDRIVIAGREFVVSPTHACRLRPQLALASPEQVAMARPTGVGHALTTRIPIEGRDEWLAAARVRSA